MKRIAIVGLGLIGGSFALDLKRLQLVEEIIGYDASPEACKEAKALGIADDAFSDWSDHLEEVDLVMLAVPVKSLYGVVEAIHERLGEKTLISDMGSVKKPFVDFMNQPTYQHLNFVGGHPISGSERFGPSSAREGLFQNKRCVLTPTEHTKPEVLQSLRSLWEGVGAVLYEMTPEFHDEVFAEVSHLPHLLAYASVEAIGENGHPELLKYSGAGLKDFSRIASSSPEMWADIFLENQDFLLESFKRLRHILDSLESSISQEDRERLLRHLRKAKQWRDQWMN